MALSSLEFLTNLEFLTKMFVVIYRPAVSRPARKSVKSAKITYTRVLAH